jgi:hypothetical protein
MEFTNPGSIDFKLRIHSTHPEIEASRKEFFDSLNSDPDISMKVATMMNNVVEDEFALPEDSIKDIPATS